MPSTRSGAVRYGSWLACRERRRPSARRWTLSCPDMGRGQAKSLTSCMPCHPHPFTPPSAALLGTIRARAASGRRRGSYLDLATGSGRRCAADRDRRTIEGLARSSLDLHPGPE
jgi:hypothetical protein